MAEERRHHTNPWLRDHAKDTVLQIQPQEELDSLRPLILAELEESLKRIDSHYSVHSSDQSIYTGTGGVALLHLHLAQTVFAATDSDHADSSRAKHELSICLSLIEPSLSRLKTHRKTFLCGAAGPLAMAAVVYHQLNRDMERADCIEQLRRLFVENRKEFDEMPSELLYGTAGYLYALLFVNSFIPGTIESVLIDEVCKLLLSNGLKNSQLSFPLMYTWHGKHYLGAAHGLAGIIAILLQVVHSEVVKSHKDAIKSTIDGLLSLQLASGNFPSSLESVTRDKLVQWCHGAPGFVHMLALAYQVYGEKRYLTAMEQCGEAVWERGLLTKGYGLCHGVAGNGYTFLQLYRVTGHSYHLHRAVKFCEWCLKERGGQSSPDRPFSLFEGVAGKEMFLADVYHDVAKSRFPALELPAH